MNEIIVNELPDTCGDCGFHDFITDPDGQKKVKKKPLIYIILM